MLRIVPGLSVAIVMLASDGGAAAAGQLRGEVSYRERIVLPPNAIVEVTLLDITRRDGLGELVAAVQIRPRGQVPIRFEIRFADHEIDPRRIYGIHARILVDDRLRFATTTMPRVLTQGHPDSVRVLLTSTSVGSGAEVRQLTERTWLAVDIGGQGMLDDAEAKLSITSAGQITGSAGCNTLTGSAQMDGTSLAFGAFATTRKMCRPAVMEHEARFLRALELTREFRVEGQHLRFLSGDGTELARFIELK